jgi:hypothetical protein
MVHPVMSHESMRARTGRAGLLLLAGLLLAGCPRNVDGDAHSGKDVRFKGAKKIKLEDNEGQSRTDIVTYPGGDRVDWKVFEIPEGQSGTIRVTLRWRPPRPGLDLAFDVFDQYFHRIGRAKPSAGAGKRSKKVTIADAEPGKYYVQVYAPRRTDAGTYRVQVHFKPGGDAPAVAAAPSDIPDPPTLPALPEAAEVVDSSGGAGPTPPVDPVEVGPAAPTAQPVKARVVRYVLSTGGSVAVTVDRGKNSGVETGWKGQILNASGRAVEGGEFVVQKVTGAESIGKVSLSVDQVKANKRVLLSPP